MAGQRPFIWQLKEPILCSCRQVQTHKSLPCKKLWLRFKSMNAIMIKNPVLVAWVSSLQLTSNSKIRSVKFSAKWKCSQVQLRVHELVCAKLVSSFFTVCQAAYSASDMDLMLSDAPCTKLLDDKVALSQTAPWASYVMTNIMSM